MKILIWQRRSEKGMSLIELAEKSGIKKSTLNDYENEKTRVPAQCLEDIAKALDIDIIDLIESDFINRKGNK